MNRRDFGIAVSAHFGATLYAVADKPLSQSEWQDEIASELTALRRVRIVAVRTPANRWLVLVANRIGFTSVWDRRSASGCSPPHLTMTQLLRLLSRCSSQEDWDFHLLISCICIRTSWGR